ncbi:16S rRNA (uracil1498-N3)-methyltransferase [Carnobacterium iners]|uniref:Ribosomal RNA small subunit methyltransferase E n=1 Tax=Carnobacterium iners TaxID=1073423 RepID=A0A1X7NGH4_9LACT|nr:16S rRNA (uracil(1498)-N(3))-methyltransferase [Carnobacterium iners]SEK40777.1 16S rRNA (uracil1498-N3)-methyltransferase [Carnobacterium iners]SMH36821.1 16S rRNA (uracil1498-N3)-methyltransferase [Carnobacterium iners]
MQRYFITENRKDSYQTIEIRLTGEQHHHMTRVMRMEVGKTVYLVFPDQKAIVAKLTKIESDFVSLLWVSDETSKKELPLEVTVASGLPKGDKLDYIIQKGTELGASFFIPFQASFSITKWDKKKSDKKITRLNKIAQEAAEQSHRTRIPGVTPIVSFKELVNLATSYDACIVAYEESAKKGEMTNFAKVVNKLRPNDRVLLVFGPEGGLSREEIDSLTEAGMITCSLGPRILRTETAPLYALAAISYHFELNK